MSKAQADFLKSLPQTAANFTAIDAGVPSDAPTNAPVKGGIIATPVTTGPLAALTHGKSVAIAASQALPEGLFINTR